MTSKRTDIVRAADRIYYRDGFAEVGIDRLVGEAGVALGTLYRHFKSRSEVVAGAMQQRETDFLDEIVRQTADCAGAERVLRIFDVLEDWSAARGGNGCFFLRAATEHPQDAGIQKAALDHKQRYLALIKGQLLRGGWSAGDAGRLAPAVFVLLEGAVAAAFALGDEVAIPTARGIAALLLSEPRCSEP